MTSRTYNQFCALASALDVIGERWTLLIIREMMLGPRRFTDIMEGLPGISTNLLSERLKNLEQQGVLIRRTLPPPAGSTVYQLTEFGQGLEKAVIELGRWGSQLLPRSLDGVSLPSTASMALAIKAFFHPELAQRVNVAYELHLGEEVIEVKIHEGEIAIRQGEASKPDAIFRTDMKTFLGIFTGQLPVDTALAAGLIRVKGDPTSLSRFLSYAHVPTE